MGRWLLAVRPRNLFKILAVLAALLFVLFFRANAIFVMVTLYVLSGPLTGLGNFIRYGRLTRRVED